MDKSNQTPQPVIVIPTEHTLILSWNIATDPKLYRELAPNPYSPRALHLILERFPKTSLADVTQAIVLAEPEGRYDRVFKELPKDLQAAESFKQIQKTSEIIIRLEEYFIRYAPDFKELSEELMFDRLSKVAFEINDLKEIEQKFSQKQRIDFKLLILKYIERLEPEAFINDIPRLKLFVPPAESQAKTLKKRLGIPLTRRSLLTVYASATLVFISFPASDLIRLQTQPVQVLPSTSAPVTRKEIQRLPVRLQIPRIEVDANMEFMGINSEGEMEVPIDTANAGWYKLGPSPGERGSAVISGHFDGKKGKSGVFNKLDKLKKGDEILVTNDLGVIFTFVVQGSRTYNPGYAEEVFLANDNGTHLNLVTCDGIWDQDKKSYTKRLVVFADRI